MSKPEDIPEGVWHTSYDACFRGDWSVVEEVARAIMAAKAEAEAERDLLQDVLDSRPAINAALPDSYIRWSQAIYSGDFARTAIARATGETP